MSCEQVRWLLSFEPRGATEPADPGLQRHLESCPHCRAFWQALQSVDEALVARPMLAPGAGFVAGVASAIRRSHPDPALASPFSRAFCVAGAALALVALAVGALLLQRGLGPSQSLTAGPLWLNPAWPNDASAWLSRQSQAAAEFVLAMVAGIIVTIAGVAVGFRASAGQAQDPAEGHSTILPPR